MNKSAIKNFAINARRKLVGDKNQMGDIPQMAFNIGIDSKKIYPSEKFSDGYKIDIKGKTQYITNSQNEQRETLIAQIKEKGYEQVMEEVAYTWFNRIIAIRFMEVNDYLPSGIRILSSVDKDRVEPDAIREVRSLIDEIKLDADTVYKFQDENDTDGLFKYILIKQCNELNKIMPVMFDKINDYTEILLPDKLLGENSVVTNLVNDIDEEDFKEQVEIIGWMYQYYISEKKDEVFADLKKNKKITKENIPAATQLFTPDWIVKYMVENSLGRLWLEGHPDEDLQSIWKYYLEEAKQEPEVEKELEKIKEESKNLNPEDITVLDPSMGSGHILVYAFDVLYQIYESQGYSERDIPRLILENNIYGLDIDDRAGQLAYFALMMKARSKYRRFFRDVERNPISLNVCSIQESNGLTVDDIEYFANGDTDLKKDLEYLVEVYTDAKEYGSILEVKKVDFERLENRLKEIEEDIADLFSKDSRERILDKVNNLIMQGKSMSKKYYVMCTNPPYMGSKGMSDKLRVYLEEKYNKSKSDLCTVFMELDKVYIINNGFMSMINQHTWMFLTSFDELREDIIKKKVLINMLHLGTRAFQEVSGEVVQSTAFILRKSRIKKYMGTYIDLKHFNNTNEKKIGMINAKDKTVNYKYLSNIDRYELIPNKPIAYWISDKIIEVFKNQLFYEYSISDGKNVTGDNQRFLRNIWEVNCYSIGKNKTWLPYAKGGTFRKWFGNIDYIINWSDEARYHYRKDKVGRIIPEYLWYKKGITWTLITSGLPSFRLLPEEATFDSGGLTIFLKNSDNIKYYMGLFNSKIFVEIQKILNPTLNLLIKDIRSIPIVESEKNKVNIENLVQENIIMCEEEWNRFEVSLDFKKHPIVEFKSNNIETSFNSWSDFTDKQFNVLKSNEEELNKIFIDIYGLQDDLISDVEDKDVTIRKADRDRDIKSFISYAVGCMLGRYSLDTEGLAFAGGEFDESKYNTFKVDTDGILPITDKEYFEDDIVSKFVEFVKVVFGEESLEENLEYIVNTECFKRKKGETARNTLRRYFLKGFIEDHIKIYQKRPIYWMFDSGKQNGFRALIYMHRYNEGTVAKVRTDYLHELQRKYEQEISILDVTINSEVATAKEKADAKKEKQRVQKQIAECIDYDSVVAHVANQKINIDLDDGVKVNYSKFNESGEGDLLFKIKM